jgi:ankyrin repeat protein
MRLLLDARSSHFSAVRVAELDAQNKCACGSVVLLMIFEFLLFLLEACSNSCLLFTGRDGWTAIMLAAREGYVDAVKLLVEFGANADIVSVLVPSINV